MYEIGNKLPIIFLLAYKIRYNLIKTNNYKIYREITIMYNQ